ncbi:HAD family phosphatase [archaeon]|nr:HAD family phosphatase [archaeon]PJC45195.1 MAG: hypothetical protein CO037_02765 [Candidatus Pacearchaeota archaeon CG_4_9_14_0_2_um_filter_30_8]
MRGDSKVKVIVFDGGGVLQLNVKRHYKKGIQETFASKFKLNLDDYLDSIDTNYANSMEGLISKKELLKNLSKNLGFSEKRIEKIFSKVYLKRVSENKRLLNFAKRIKKEGIKVAILSDQWHLSKEPLIPLKFYKIFNPIIVSCDVGVRKPNPKIYKILLKKLKVNPEEVLFIDNRSWNLSPAKKIGMKTILFVNNKILKKQLKEFLIKL